MSANAPTQILALSLPAGSYIMQATVGLHGDIPIGTLVPFSNVQWSFAKAGGPFDTGSRMLVGGSPDSSAPVPLLAAVNLGAPDTVTVACSKDSGVIEVYTRASTVTAIQVGTLTGPQILRSAQRVDPGTALSESTSRRRSAT